MNMNMFDNCDEYPSVKDYVNMLTDLVNFKILITTRDENLVNNFKKDVSKVIHLEPFDKSECTEFISKKLEDLINEESDSEKLFSNKSEHDKALNNYERSLEIYKNIYGENDHINLAYALTSIGNSLIHQSKYSDALENFQKSLEIFKANGSDIQRSPLFKYSQMNAIIGIGRVYYMLGQYTEAISYYEESLQIKKFQRTGDDDAMGSLFNDLGLVLCKQGKRKEALENFEKSLTIYRKVFGTEDHISVAATLGNMGLLLRDQGRYHEALEKHQHSLKIYENIYDTDFNENFINGLKNIGEIYH